MQHAIFLRSGGVSQGAFSSLNVSFSTGDDPACVRVNRQKVFSFFPTASVYVPSLEHGSSIVQIGKGSTLSLPCDALFTLEKHQGLMVTHADCQSAIFYDPVCESLAVVHCGWRGNVQNIYEKMVQVLCLHGSKAGNIHVGISPSMGPQAAEFIHYQTEFPSSFQDFHVGSNFFNLWELSRYQLERAGVLPEHIEIAQLCTVLHPAECFSYRRDKITGRHATLACLL